MNIMFQIEYNRNTTDDHERKMSGDVMRIETLSCMDLTTDEGKSYAHELLDEFIKFHVQYPQTAKVWFGGVCDSHSH